MKIDNTKLTGPQHARRRSGAAAAEGGASFASAFAEDGAASTASSSKAGGLSQTSAAADVGALLALQAADAEEGNAAASKRARARADELLRKMDQLRLDLLSGGIPRDHLISLAQATKTARENVFDPRLSAILDEIDLRAQVELAKYTPGR